jgi:hypothetical protein
MLCGVERSGTSAGMTGYILEASMPKYKIKIDAEIEVEAPNVAKAAAVGKKRVRLIGQHVGGERDSHDKNFWHKSVRDIGFSLSNPVRIKI